MADEMRAVRIAIAACALSVLNSCESPEVIIDDWGTAGYAIVEGSVSQPNGEPYSGDVFITCGLEGPGQFGRKFDTSGPGRYRAALEWPDAAMAEMLAAAGWRGICRVSAPGSSPPFASVTDTVIFAPTEAARVENTIDL